MRRSKGSQWLPLDRCMPTAFPKRRIRMRSLVWDYVGDERAGRLQRQSKKEPGKYVDMIKRSSPMLSLHVSILQMWLFHMIMWRWVCHGEQDTRRMRNWPKWSRQASWGTMTETWWLQNCLIDSSTGEPRYLCWWWEALWPWLVERAAAGWVLSLESSVASRPLSTFSTFSTGAAAAGGCNWSDILLVVASYCYGCN